MKTAENRNRSTTWRYASEVLGFALLYLASIGLSYRLMLAESAAMPIWLASGLYLAVLLARPPAQWWRFVLAALVVEGLLYALLEFPPFVSLGSAVANMLAALTAAGLWRSYDPVPPQLDQLRDVIVLTLVALLATALGALVGAATLAAGYGVDFAITWQAWWSAGVLGVWVIAPLVLTLKAGCRRLQSGATAACLAEVAALLATFGMIIWLSFGNSNALTSRAYFTLPLLLWTALRFGVVGVSVMLTLLTLLATQATIAGYGSFVHPQLSLAQEILVMQWFFSISALCFLALAAMTAERRRAVQTLRTLNRELEQRIDARTQGLAQTNQALQASERRFQIATLLVGGVVYEWDMASGIVNCSNSLHDLIGMVPDAVPVTQQWWAARIHPDDRDRVAAQFDAAIGNGGDYYVLEYRAQHADGSWIEVWDNGMLQRDTAGRATRVVGFVLDITTRKCNEAILRRRSQEFQALVENSPDIIARFDRQLRHLYVNPAVERATGLPVAMFIGKTNRELGMPVDRCQLWENQLHTVFEHGQELCIEFSFNGPQGERYYQTRYVPECGTDGAVESVLVVAADVTERSMAERALEEARRAADAANTAKSAFLASMSHEIRTPMAAILGYADLLAVQLNQPALLAHVETIRRNGRHLLALINDILDVSKIEAGRLEISREPCLLASLLAEVRALMVLRAEEKNLPLVVECTGPLPVTVTTDGRRLKQILINLLGNAIKFTTQGQVTLQVSRVAGEQPALSFAVIDTGPGIALADQARLFQPFNQLHDPTEQPQGGTGLGLVISQRLAGLLGGTITLHSQPGVGSTFTLTVPVAKSDDVSYAVPDLATAALPTVTAPVAPVRLAGRVLVAEDQDDIRYLVTRYLEEAGAVVTAVADGPAVLAALTQAQAALQPFAALVLDIQLPGLSGYAVAQQLRAQGHTLPIVALTSFVMPGDRDRCLAAGCDDYLGKPVERYQLCAVLARLLSVTPKPDSVAAACRVLLVEDNLDVADALALMLQMLGYVVVVAHTGQQALAVARIEQPDVVVMDLMLPDLSGYEVCQQMHSEPLLQQTVFIALSGHTDAAAKVAAAGFDHYVPKPADVQELVALFPRHVPVNSVSASAFRVS